MDNQSSITYADDWKSADNFVYYQPEPEEEAQPSERKTDKKQSSKPIVFILQIVICALLLASAYCLKCFGGDYYKDIRETYYNAINDEIIPNEKFEDFDLNKLFNEIKN